MSDLRAYTTQLQAGLGMVNETLDLLRVVEEGDTPTRLSERVLAQGLFARTTARRTRNIVAEMFAPRYFVHGDQPARWLQTLLRARTSIEDLSQLFFLHTARAQAIFGDFLLQSYWPRYGAGATSISRAEAESFIHRALDAGRMQKRWTETTIRRVSGYLLGCCSDFGLLESTARQNRPIQRFYIRPKAALYLVHDLHFLGMSDESLVHHPDWQFFGLDPSDALAQIKRLANDGHLLIQSSADLTRISWKHKSMEEAIRAIT